MAEPAPPPKPETSPEDRPVLIERPNVLRERVGGSLDATLAARADNAVQALASNFPHWIAETIEQLVKVRAELAGQPLQGEARRKLYPPVLEAKSLGQTYGYPLITSFAHSLSRLLDRLPDDIAAPDVLVNAHIDAIRACLLLPAGSAGQDQIANKLFAEIEAQVNALLAKSGV